MPLSMRGIVEPVHISMGSQGRGLPATVDFDLVRELLDTEVAMLAGILWPESANGGSIPT